MTFTQENWKDHWEEVKAAISGVKNTLVQEGGLDPGFAYWQAVYTVSSTINVSAVELWLEINKAKGAKEMTAEEKPSYELVDRDDMPSRSSIGGGGPCKWSFLYDLMFGVLKTGGEALKFRFPNKRDARLGSSGAQSIAWTLDKERKCQRRRLLPKDIKVVTVTEPIDPNRKDGEWYLWVRLDPRT